MRRNVRGAKLTLVLVLCAAIIGAPALALGTGTDVEPEPYKMGEGDPYLMFDRAPVSAKDGLEWFNGGGGAYGVPTFEASTTVPGATPCFRLNDGADTESVPTPLPEGVHEISIWNEVSAIPGPEEDFEVRVDVTPPAFGVEVPVSSVGSVDYAIDVEDNVAGVWHTWANFYAESGAYVSGTDFGTAEGHLVGSIELAPGRYKAIFQTKDQAYNWSESEKHYLDVAAPDGYVPEPVEGANRIATAIAASQEAFPKGLCSGPDGDKTVVIATAYNFPDALGGAALAGAYEGALLLTEPGALPTSVAEEIVRLGADRAFVVGGTAAVSDNVYLALKTKLGAEGATRLEGADRYATANLIAKTAMEVLASTGRWTHTCFVTTGGSFPDALSAGPLASSKGWPLFLADERGLGAEALGLMETFEMRDVYILGGTAVVSQEVEDALVAAGYTVVRLAGSDRYETAYKVALESARQGLSWDGVALATGEDFPDALAGGVMQGATGSMVLLTGSDSLDGWARKALAEHDRYVMSVRYLGGNAAISQGVRDQVSALLK
jgi:lactocepin